MGRLVWLSVATASVALPGRRAEACSEPPVLDVGARSTLPGDGALDVPLNARVLVEYAATAGVIAPAVELRQAGGAVAATITTAYARFHQTIVLTPDAPLAPSTTYEVWDAVVVPCAVYPGDPVTCAGAPALIATFTTGTTSDTQPPSVDDVALLELHYYEPDPFTTCDWDGPWLVATLAHGAVHDDRPLDEVRFAYDDRGPLPFTTVGQDCGTPWVPTYDVPLAGDQVTVRAVDLAGNVEATGHTVTGLGCADAIPPVDAGPTPDAGGDPAPPDGGCCSSSSSAASPAALLAVLLLRRRRR